MLNRLRKFSVVKSMLQASIFISLVYIIVAFFTINERDRSSLVLTDYEFLPKSIQIVSEEMNANQSSTTNGVKSVGFLLMATGRYSEFIQANLESFRKYVFLNSSTHKYRIIYFTDARNISDDGEDVAYIYQKKLSWPYDSLNRFNVYLKNEYLLESFDYLVALDIDIIWIQDTTPEFILNDHIFGIHLAFPGIATTSFESRNWIQAYVPLKKQRQCYYCYGGFYGGKKDNFFRMVRTMNEWKEVDQKNGYEPIWHDESYLNRYICDNFERDQSNVKFLERDFLREEGRNITSKRTKVLHIMKKDVGALRS